MVDSSEAIPLNDPSISRCSFKQVGFWFIDYRHNKNRPTRVPADFQNATILQERGGWIFQSQFEDVEDCRAAGLSSVSWLPLAADAEIWTSEPPVPKEFHIGFVGNIWDLQRKRALDLLLRTKGLQVGFAQGKIWKEEAAALMRRCMIGFNINTFFGEPWLPSWNRRGRRERMFLFASGGEVAHTQLTSTPDRQISDRARVSDHPVRSFQSRTPLLFQEGNSVVDFAGRRSI